MHADWSAAGGNALCCGVLRLEAHHQSATFREVYNHFTLDVLLTSLPALLQPRLLRALAKPNDAAATAQQSCVWTRLLMMSFLKAAAATGR